MAAGNIVRSEREYELVNRRFRLRRPQISHAKKILVPEKLVDEGDGD